MSSLAYEETEYSGSLDPNKYTAMFDFTDDNHAIAVTVKGPCPRCAHTSTDGHPLYRFHGFSPDSTDKAALRDFGREVQRQIAEKKVEEVKGVVRADLLCQCKEAHTHQPKLGDGCGASWTLEVEVPA
jgi:hypothetical protein